MPERRPWNPTRDEAKRLLLNAWFEAHPNQPMGEGRDIVERCFAALRGVPSSEDPVLADMLRRFEEAAGRWYNDAEDLRRGGLRASMCGHDDIPAEPLSVSRAQAWAGAAEDVRRVMGMPRMWDTEYRAYLMALPGAKR